MIPVVALVGRPNVGKSTLFNQLTRSRDALVADFPGLTRDRKYGEAKIGTRPFVVIDTGGISGDEDGIDSQMAEQSLTAIEEAKKICKVKQVNAVGYCIAGTTLSLTLSLMKQRGDKSIKSATFFTTLTDFGEQGEFTPFLQNDFVDGIEEQV